MIDYNLIFSKNGRRRNFCFKWKTTSIFLMEADLNSSKLEDDLNFFKMEDNLYLK